jgi:hypothetical protein
MGKSGFKTAGAFWLEHVDGNGSFSTGQHDVIFCLANMVETLGGQIDPAVFLKLSKMSLSRQ